jgi:hypothetical protein
MSSVIEGLSDSAAGGTCGEAVLATPERDHHAVGVLGDPDQVVAADIDRSGVTAHLQYR